MAEDEDEVEAGEVGHGDWGEVGKEKREGGRERREREGEEKTGEERRQERYMYVCIYICTSSAPNCAS